MRIQGSKYEREPLTDEQAALLERFDDERAGLRLLVRLETMPRSVVWLTDATAGGGKVDVGWYESDDAADSGEARDRGDYNTIGEALDAIALWLVIAGEIRCAGEVVAGLPRKCARANVSARLGSGVLAKLADPEVGGLNSSRNVWAMGLDVAAEDLRRALSAVEAMQAELRSAKEDEP